MLRISNRYFPSPVKAKSNQFDAFDDAVKGVVGVVHMASPFHSKAEDPKELIGPAVGGTEGILQSLKKHK